MRESHVYFSIRYIDGGVNGVTPYQKWFAGLFGLTEGYHFFCLLY